MPQIDFYLIPGNNPSDQNGFICRITEKIYHLKHRIYILSDSEENARFLDNLLWTYRDQSFIPHQLTSAEHDLTEPILIGVDQNPASHNDILINCTQDVPTFYQNFNRIIEIVSQDEKQKSFARLRFRYYKENGYIPTSHQIAH